MGHLGDLGRQSVRRPIDFRTFSQRGFIDARLVTQGQNRGCQIGIGEGFPLSPATPPGMRFRTGRFERLRSTEMRDAQFVRPSQVQDPVK